MWENINNVNTKVDRLREDFNEVRYYVDEHITGQLEDLQDQINKLNSKQANDEDDGVSRKATHFFLSSPVLLPQIPSM